MQRRMNAKIINQITSEISTLFFENQSLQTSLFQSFQASFFVEIIVNQSHICWTYEAIQSFVMYIEVTDFLSQIWS